LRRYIFFVVVTLVLFSFTSSGFAMNKFTQESWIGAYIFDKKSLSSAEQYYPYLDIRNINFRINSPGYAVKTIIADYIITQDFDIIKSLKAEDALNKAEDDKDLLAILENLSQNASKEQLERKILEMKTLLLLRDEVRDRQKFLKLISGEKYNRFKYRFYHFKLIEYEDYILSQKVDFTTDINYDFGRLEKLRFGLEETSAQRIIDQALMRLSGAYNQKLKILDGEIQASMMTTERINSMLPIYPNSLANKESSPLVSLRLQPMELKLKRKLVSNFNKLKFDWKQKVTLLKYQFNKEELTNIADYFNLFTNKLLEVMKSSYRDKYGELKFLEDYQFTLNNLNQILREVKLMN